MATCRAEGKLLAARRSQGLAILVCEAYPREVRQRLREAGASEAGELWRWVLLRLAADVAVDVVCAADLDCPLPSGGELERYGGVVWTGSSLTVYHDQDPRVQRQIELVRAAAARGVPQFGSCWGVQLATVAFGGRCAAHPVGREFGIAQPIQLLAAAVEHPMYTRKPAAFLAFTSHADHVVTLPEGAQWLAANLYSPVQALALETPAPFWGVQYHPEYDFHEIARLCVFRAEELLRQRRFASEAAVERFVAACEALHRDPGCAEAAQELGADRTLLDDSVRRREIANWLAFVRKRAESASSSR